jgi:hypothetical protein
MKQLKHLGIIVAIVISLFLIFSQTVYATTDVGTFGQLGHAYYIDAGTGSIIIQVLIGAVVGGLALIGVYRVRVRNFFTNLFNRHRQDKESGKSTESGEVD